MSRDENQKPSEAGKSKKDNPDKKTQELLRKLANMMSMSNKDTSAAKPIEEYKFWKTQPVVKFESEIYDQGAIQHNSIENVKKVPQQLPSGFEWCTVDITDGQQMKDLYELLYGNYIEDEEEQFRFRYSENFLRWALMPPGWKNEWNVGVRATINGKLVAFINSIPTRLRVRSEIISMVEINFMCVHKKLRSKRLAPVLIKEVTRRVNLHNIWQALYTGGTLLPTPVSACRYYHRTLNWQKLNEVGFNYLPPNSSPAEEIAKFALPTKCDLAGFRRMTSEDIVKVLELYQAYMKKYDLVQEFSEEELRHWLIRPGIVYSYVVEKDNQITCFVSFYGLQSTIIGNPKHDSISVAYSFLYASNAPPDSLTQSLQDLFQAALIEASNYKFDVYNALTLMDNPLVLEPLKFAKGTGTLYYYLFNYKTKRIDGGCDIEGVPTKPGGIGVIVL